MWLRLAAHADVAYVGGCDQAFHREHPGSLSEQLDWFGGADGYRELRCAFETLLGDPAIRVPTDELRQVVRRRLAERAVASAAHEYDCGRANDELTRRFVAFAVETWPPIRASRSWRSLERRRRQGAAWAAAHPWVVGLRAYRRARRIVRDRRWERWGLYERA